MNLIIKKGERKDNLHNIIMNLIMSLVTVHNYPTRKIVRKRIKTGSFN